MLRCASIIDRHSSARYILKEKKMSAATGQDATAADAQLAAAPSAPTRKVYTLTPDGDYVAADGTCLPAEEVRRRMMNNNIVVAGGFQDMMARLLSAKVTSVTLPCEK